MPIHLDGGHDLFSFYEAHLVHPLCVKNEIDKRYETFVIYLALLGTTVTDAVDSISHAISNTVQIVQKHSGWQYWISLKN